MTRDVIRTEGLGRHYGQRVGIESVDLRLDSGTAFGFLGPNGAGKTTTIRILLGFMRATSGRARILDQDCWSDSHRIKRDVGYLPSDLRLYGWMTTTSALRISGRIRGLDLAAAGAAVAERFELEMDVPVRAMSRGTRQKLGIVLALAHAPRLLIMDEPTSGLDPLMQDELARSVRALADAGGTVFFSSHTLSEVESICDRVAIVRRGRIVEDATLGELRLRARRRVELHFETSRACEVTAVPASLALLERGERRWTCELLGSPRDLSGWIASQAIIDFGLSPPDLEALFRGYYRDEEAS